MELDIYTQTWRRPTYQELESELAGYKRLCDQLKNEIAKLASIRPPPPIILDKVNWDKFVADNEGE